MSKGCPCINDEYCNGGKKVAPGHSICMNCANCGIDHAKCTFCRVLTHSDQCQCYFDTKSKVVQPVSQDSTVLTGENIADILDEIYNLEYDGCDDTLETFIEWLRNSGLTKVIFK